MVRDRARKSETRREPTRFAPLRAIVTSSFGSAAGRRAPGTIRSHALPHSRPMSWKARFTPQAWINDYAVDVDPEGPTDWELTDAEAQRALPEAQSAGADLD